MGFIFIIESQFYVSLDCILSLLQWLENTFLQYLFDWEVQAQQEKGLKASERARKFISRPTFVGLVMTGTDLQKIIQLAALRSRERIACFKKTKFYVSSESNI